MSENDDVTMQIGDQLPDVSSSRETLEEQARGHPALPGALLRIPVSVQVVIGTVRLPLSQVTQLSPGTTLTLDEKLGTPARVLVNGREIARGELFVLDGSEGRLGLTIKDVSRADEDG